jgi:membrane protein DedA with SNARE-associated domain
LFDFLFDLLSSPWAYPIVFGIAALDAVLPAVPSESLAITAGVLCGVGKLHLAPTIAAAALGAFLGDTTSYVLGRTLGPRVRGRLFRGKRSERALDWADRMLKERGGYLIVVARFIPGGRTATTFTAGMVRFPAWRFVGFAAVAAIGWSVYAVMLGYLGGRIFEENPLLALAVALGIALTITAVVEAVRRFR